MAEQGNSVMSNNKNDGRNGFKSSRIDLSQLGDDTWNKPVGRRPVSPGPRRRQTQTTPIAPHQRTHLDELFESRVKAAAARRSVKQSRGQNRVWMFAGGLFLASVGGVAAAYYLVGPPMAATAYTTDGADYQAAQTSSLEVDANIAGTSSHFQGVPVPASVTAEPEDDVAAAVVAAPPPPADNVSDQDALVRAPVAAAPETQAEAAEPALVVNEPSLPAPEEVAATPQPAADTTQPAEAVPVEERLVHIVPTSVSDEIKTKTNVNTAQSADVSGGSDGQWVALPPEQKPAAPSVVTAAATQQSNETKPVDGPVKTQQELFEAFQAYLKSSGHTATGDQDNQEALFNKFMRWSVEAPKEN